MTGTGTQEVVPSLRAVLETVGAIAADLDLDVTLQRIIDAATELARDWRTDRALRRLEAMMIVVSPEHMLLVTGQGDVVAPSDGVLGIGSGGQLAVATARGLIKHSSLAAADIVRESLLIASEIDVYTNQNIVVEEMSCPK